MIFQGRGRPQSNGDKNDLRLFSNKNMIFQGRGRPQGNGDKTDLRLFLKKTIFQFRLFYYFLASWPPAVFLFFGLRLF